MNDQDIALFIKINEPSFVLDGKEYSVCCPDGGFATWDSDGNTFDFPDIRSLLDEWIVGGKPFREVKDSVL